MLNIIYISERNWQCKYCFSLGKSHVLCYEWIWIRWRMTALHPIFRLKLNVGDGEKCKVEKYRFSLTTSVMGVRLNRGQHPSVKSSVWDCQKKLLSWYFSLFCALLSFFLIHTILLFFKKACFSRMKLSIVRKRKKMM